MNSIISGYSNITLLYITLSGIQYFLNFGSLLYLPNLNTCFLCYHARQKKNLLTIGLISTTTLLFYPQPYPSTLIATRFLGISLCLSIKSATQINWMSNLMQTATLIASEQIGFLLITGPHPLSWSMKNFAILFTINMALSLLLQHMLPRKNSGQKT